MPVPPGLSPKDADQVIRAVMDDDTNRLRVDAVISPSGHDLEIHHEDDSIAIGTPTDLFTSTTVGPKIGLDVNLINSLPLDINITAASGDNIAIADQTGTNFVTVNPDGSINITDNGGSITVDGTVAVSNFPSTQDVNVVSSVEIEIANDVGNPIPVSGTVTANAGTGDFTVVQPSGANLHVNIDNFPATQAVTQSTSPWVVGDGGGSLTVDNNGTFAVQAAQSGTWNINNITGTVSLPTGAATEATLSTRLADSTFTGRINTQGQKAMAASTPVVIASDQTPLVATASSVTTFNATGTSATVLAANSARKGASFYNDGGGVIYLKLGATASATSYTVRMPDNTFYELPYPVYTGVIDAVSAAGTRSLRVTELT